MANNCYDTDLLKYSGTSQAQRALLALQSQYAKIDERTTAQLILFAKKYAAYLNYFDATDQVTGDWQDFMSADVSVTIADIADWRAKDFMPFIDAVTQQSTSAVTDDDARMHFKTLFDFIFTLVSWLDADLRRLPDDVSYDDFLSVAITSNLSSPFNILYNYYRLLPKSGPLALIDESSHYIDPNTPISPVIFSGDFNPANLSSVWNFYEFDPPEITLNHLSAQDDISHTLTHNLFTGPLQLFINGIINIVSKTPVYLEETLNNYPSHQPHYALYLAFLRLFRFAQDHVNNFTQEHLDFYYKDVLQLTERNAEPGFVHLVFELQKNVDQYLLTKDTAFKAGKDAAGHDIAYALTGDVVLQKTTVQSLKSLYLDKDNTQSLFASPQADTEDGNGGKLTSADKSWFTFGNPKKISTAKTGFAFASNVLFLNEGKRTITFTFNCDKAPSLSLTTLANMFTIKLTGKKDWYTVDGTTATIISNGFTLTVSLDGDAPAIVPYSEKVHKENFDTTLPVAEATLNDASLYQAVKDLNIKNIVITVSATIKDLSLQSKDGKIDPAKPFKPFGDFPGRNATFIIGSEEIFQKHLSALTIKFDWQPADTALITAVINNTLDFASIKRSYTTQLNKEFSASVSSSSSSSKRKTSQTVAEKSFSSSSSQSKSSSSLESRSFSSTEIDVMATQMANAEILSAVTSKLTAPADMLALKAGVWGPTAIKSISNVTSSTITLDQSTAAAIPVTPAEFDGNSDYNIKAVSGFIELKLTTDNYSLSTYLDNIQKALKPTVVTVTSSDGVPTKYTAPAPQLPPQAPQLVANGIEVDYTATATISFNASTQDEFNNNQGVYYHTEPFGLRAMHPFLTTDAITLLPVFNLDNNLTNGTGGELWIGLKDAFADEVVTVLFEVSDGSSNPLKEMTTLNWYYLSNNNWLPFDATTVADDTNNLTRSGIVTLTLPHTITTGGTRADNILRWIKFTTTSDTDAVCKLIAVRANAVKASFVQDLSKGIEYTSTLPSNIISKPVSPISALKKTEQPYTSFGGRLHETDDRFYIRVSERLRHKNRAVTMWDYERLVLDYFPQVHKAKCISHTGFITNSATLKKKYSETLGGHVMVVTVPDLSGNVTANPLRPYTSVGLLEEIQQYLGTLTSPFVKLHVTNPQFEEVQFEFEVTFYEGFDQTYYTNQLNNEIEQFLTPWMYETGRDIEFGGRIEKSVVLNFVEERPYVDFVTCFKMNQFIRDDEGFIVTANYNIEEAVASTARSILVSFSEDNGDTVTKHLIQSPANCNCNG